MGARGANAARHPNHRRRRAGGFGLWRANRLFAASANGFGFGPWPKNSAKIRHHHARFEHATHRQQSWARLRGFRAVPFVDVLAARHGGLLQQPGRPAALRGALATLAGVPSLVPLPHATQDGSVVFPELVNREGGVLLLNHAAPGTLPLPVRVQTAGAGDWLWSGGVTLFSNDSAAPIPGRRPAPIEKPDDFEARARPISIYARLEAGAMENAQMRPIKLQNTAGGPIAAKLVEESANQLKLNVWPNSPTVIYSSDEWQPALGEAAPIRVQILPGEGGLQPRAGQRFAVQITDYAQKADKKGRFAVASQVVLADARGKLDFSFSGVACAIEVTALDSSTREFLKKPK